MTPKDIVDKLDSLYERKSVPTQIALKDRLSTLKMKSDASLESHFNEFDAIVREAIAAGVKLDESDEISYLFRSLLAHYNTRCKPFCRIRNSCVREKSSI